MKHKGFTVVELLVVVAAIAILASITIVSYISMRDDGHDTNIRATVKIAGDAIQLAEFQNNSRITGFGYFTQGGGVDTLAPKYLKPDYRENLQSKNAAATSQILRYYNCNDGNGGFVIYASLNNPTPEDITKFNSIRNKCGHGDSQAPTSGSNKYNYAQTF